MNYNKESTNFDKSRITTEKFLQLLQDEAKQFEKQPAGLANVSFSMIEALAYFITHAVEKKSIDFMTAKACEKLKELVELYRNEK